MSSVCFFCVEPFLLLLFWMSPAILKAIFTLAVVAALWKTAGHGGSKALETTECCQGRSAKTSMLLDVVQMSPNSNEFLQLERIPTHLNDPMTCIYSPRFAGGGRPHRMFFLVRDRS